MMRVLDKIENQVPWEQLSREQRDQLVQANHLAPWLFEKKVVLTVCDDNGGVRQFPASANNAPQLSLIQRIKAWIKRTCIRRQKHDNSE